MGSIEWRHLVVLEECSRLAISHPCIGAAGVISKIVN